MEELSVLLVIGSTPFIIEPEKEQLRQFNRQDHTISYQDLKRDEGNYSANFNLSRHQVTVDSREYGGQVDGSLHVVVPHQILNSPGLLTADHILDLNLLSKGQELGFYLADKNTALRISGMLPHIDLAGTDFTIDWRLKELRETESPWNHISLRDMEMSDSGEEYLCFYNTESHELFEPNEDLFEMPENVVVLEIPYEVKLDPIAVARQYGIGETDLLIDHPFQMNLKAKVTPLSETGLAAFIEENIKTRENEQGQNKRGRS